MSDSWSETPTEDSVGFASELRELAHAPPVPLEQLREQAALPAGSVVDGTFVVERVLGTGGMGVVYLARHEAADAAWPEPTPPSSPSPNARATPSSPTTSASRTEVAGRPSHRRRSARQPARPDVAEGRVGDRLDLPRRRAHRYTVQ